MNNTQMKKIFLEAYDDYDNFWDGEGDKYSLVGQDGNAFSLMGYTARCMRECGLRNEIDQMRTEATSGDYNNLIRVCDDYVQKCNDIVRNGLYESYSRLVESDFRDILDNSSDFKNALNSIEFDKFVVDDAERGKHAVAKAKEKKEVDTSVKKFYTSTYPDDDLGKEINPRLTFKKLITDMPKKDFYGMLGCGDSVVRERIFKKIASILGVDYNKVYDVWLNQQDYPYDWHHYLIGDMTLREFNQKHSLTESYKRRKLREAREDYFHHTDEEMVEIFKNPPESDQLDISVKDSYINANPKDTRRSELIDPDVTFRDIVPKMPTVNFEQLIGTDDPVVGGHVLVSIARMLGFTYPEVVEFWYERFKRQYETKWIWDFVKPGVYEWYYEGDSEPRFEFYIGSKEEFDKHMDRLYYNAGDELEGLLLGSDDSYEDK